MSNHNTDEPKPKTLTIPESKRGLHAVAEPIVGLLHRETGNLHRLREDMARFTIGSGAECDIVIDAPYVSRRHCTIEREGRRLRVVDCDSHNGTFVDGAHIDGGTLTAGTHLVLAGKDGACFVALTRLMVAALPVAQMFLGYHARGIVDDYLSTAVRQEHIAILDHPGAPHTRMIELIHRLSARRAMPLTVVERLPKALVEQQALLEQTRCGTLGLVVRAKTPAVDLLARDLLFGTGTEIQVRVILVARSAEMAVQAIGADAFARMQVISVPTVRERAGELDQIIDAGMEQAGAVLRLADLSHANATALRHHTWNGDIGEIWAVTRWLAAIDATGSERSAAKVLGLRRTTLQGWLRKRGITLPIR